MENLRNKAKETINSQSWNENPVLRFITPSIRFAIRSARSVKWKLQKARHYVRAFFYLLKRLPQKLSRTSRALRRANKLIKNGDWRNAEIALKEVLSYAPLDTTKPDWDPVTNEARLKLSVINRLNDLDSYKKSIRKYKDAKKSKKPKIAIFTAITGKYDALMLPEVFDSRFDYIVFTDNPIPDSGIYDVRPIQYFNGDNTRAARFIKTHPHWLLKDYDLAIWIDSNIMVTGEIQDIVYDFVKSKKPVGAIPHPYRQSVYEEARECKKQLKDNVDDIEAQVKHYKSVGFDNGDLIESNFMIFDLKNSRVNDFLNTWWGQIEKFSKRDQLSLNFALDKTSTKWHTLFKKPLSMRNHPSFILALHGTNQQSLELLTSHLSHQRIDPYVVDSFYDVREKSIPKRSDCKIDIVVCVHNALDDVKICLESVEKHRSSNQKLIIVDDGSDAPTADFLEKFSRPKAWVTLSRNEAPTGYTKAVNQGLGLSKGEFVILLNSDTIVTENWGEKMADAVFSTPGAGIVGPLSSAASHQSIPDHKSSKYQTAINEMPGSLSPDLMNKFCEQWSKNGILPIVPLVHGFCLGIKREVLSAIGGFDEKNFPHGYGEENDFCFRATDAGFGLVVATHTYVYHAKSKSYQDERRKQLMAAGGEAFRRLHGIQRIHRAVVSVQENPLLEDVRLKAKRLYRMADFYDPSLFLRKPGLHVAAVLRDLDVRPQSSAFIRLISPLSYLSGKLTLSILPESSTKIDKTADICIVQRTAFDTPEQAKELLGNLKKASTSLIVDVDDGFIDIDESHPEYNEQKQRLSALSLLVDECDQLWCSTDLIAQRYSEYKNKSAVVPNSLDPNIWKNARPKKPKSNKLEIVYMGTGTHHADFKMIIPALDSAFRKAPDSFRLTIIGVSKDIPKKDYITELSPSKRSDTIYPNFVKWFLKKGPFDVGISPLVDSKFNRLKSDIKVLDYLAAGALPLVSDLEPYSSKELDGFIVRAKNKGSEWTSAILELAEKKQATNAVGNQAEGRRYALKERSAEKTAQLLLKQLSSLK